MFPLKSLFFASWLLVFDKELLAFQLSRISVRGPLHQLSDNAIKNFSSSRILAKREMFNDGGKKPFRRKHADPNKLDWLKQATARLLSSKPGTLTEGKWHEVVSLLNAWSSFSKVAGTQAPVQIEGLLKVLVEERRAGNEAVEINMELYNTLLDAWACAALFKTVEDDGSSSETASQRLRKMLVLLQENFEQEPVTAPKPDCESFNIVLHVVCKTEGALTARRVLAWMEYLAKTGKNTDAEPSRSHYIQVLDAYARIPTAGVLAEAFLRHMRHHCKPELNLPDTLCYNIAIKAWSNSSHRQSKRQGREAAEHADRILEEMKELGSEQCRPDVVTYACKLETT